MTRWGMLAAVGRFPQPDFTRGYVVPSTVLPGVGTCFGPLGDAALLAGALAVGAWLVLRVRCRHWIRVAAVAALLWFGFARRGCLCPMGAVQSVVAALTGIPGNGFTLGAVALLLLPLVAALFFGRIYCATVCPHGALQDLLVVRPVRVPVALDAALRLLRSVFAGTVILFAATGAGWLLCRFDPYVVFFRLSGTSVAVLAGLAFLAVGAFVTRPYCRYLCPYGLILGLLARVAWRSPEITRERCIRCRLCERSCPMDAIETPEPAVDDLRLRGVARRRLLTLVLLALPVAFLASAAGWGVAPRLARFHPDVERAAVLARQVAGERFTEGTADALVLDAVEAEGLAIAEVGRRAEDAQRRFRRLAPWVFGCVALGTMLRLVHLARHRRSATYDAEPADCVGCGRCFAACPLNRPPLDPRSPAGDHAGV